MLRFLDILLTFVHVAIIGFNLFAWIWPATRKAHFVGVLLTAGSWFILGIWFGMGYCPVTDWQWNIKEKLGERNLPVSFIEYYAEKLTGKDFSSSFIDTITVVSFAIAVVLSIYFNFFNRKARGKTAIK